MQKHRGGYSKDGKVRAKKKTSPDWKQDTIQKREEKSNASRIE